jgi:mannosyltransferase
VAARSVDADARTGIPTSALVAALLAVAAGVLLRLDSRSDLWLDEALSVNIATLPLGEMFDALRRDGHPPLYYLLLHGWTSVFGEGDAAVRSLSGVLSLATLPLVWVAGRRYGGRSAGLAAVVLLATNPFAIRYATEARMYALVTLLALGAWLSIRVALDRMSRLALAGVAVSTGLLLLAHYWSFYLVAAAGAVLLWWWLRRGHAEARRVLAAMAAGCLLFLPWLPAFLEQAGSTGTPWGRPERPTNVLTISLRDWGGGTLDGLSGEAQLLGFGIALLVLLALFARPDGDRLEIDVTTVPHARAEVVVVFGTMALAIVAGYATASAFASRYTAGVFPIVIIVAAYGVTRLPTPVLQAGVLTVLGALGLVRGVDNFAVQRTQGGEIARYIQANGAPGDVVAFCPDQLGPAVLRVLGDTGVDALAFPDASSPRFIDWVDYAERNRESDPVAFAEMLDERAARATVWLVWAGEYRTLGTACETLTDQLRRLRPGGTAVVASSDEFEHAWLYQYGPVP